MQEKPKDQWASLTKLLEKIEAETDRLDWPEMLDHVVDVFSKYGAEKDQSKIFFECYQFLFRIYHRLLRMNEKKPMDIVYRTTKLINHEYQLYYRVVNYSFKTFMWVREHGYQDYTNNDMVEFPESALNEKQKEYFSSKAQN